MFSKFYMRPENQQSPKSQRLCHLPHISKTWSITEESMGLLLNYATSSQIPNHVATKQSIFFPKDVQDYFKITNKIGTRAFK